MLKKSYEQFHARDRQEWRAWLAENYAVVPGIWLVSYKPGSEQTCPSYEATVEEALCFGWIDSVRKKLDAERSIQLFTPRKPKSVWSKVNKRRIEILIEQGAMTEAGLAKIEVAKQDGSWSQFDAIDALHIPDDLGAALAANPSANQYFTAFSKSSKKIILWWIESAKRPETRQKRIAETVRLAEQNIKANK